MKVYLGLGSNEGDRDANLHGALEMIAALPRTSLTRTSGILHTRAEGFDGNDFLNMCCEIETSLLPRELLAALKGIETKLGREVAAPQYDAHGRRIYHNRPIDIDILLYGDEKIDEEDLQIPHPRMLERDFVMIPLNEIRNNEIL